MKISKANCPNCSKPMQITKAQCFQCGITLEGKFSLPKLALLSEEDQNFIACFLRTHGSIKKMEEIFNISYPTVKNRLNILSQKLDSNISTIKIVSKVEDGIPEENGEKTKSSNAKHNSNQKIQLLNDLNNGELTVEEVIEKLKEN